ncbi:MAG: hypothetical protein IPN90_08450 [Elusimicrobia bacterium]|nr:hypothetical protein [Elusimicrobiota bacterium]
MDSLLKFMGGASAPVSRGIRVLLSVLLFWSEGIGAFAARDLWTDRRKAVRSARENPPSPHESRRKTLAASFPTVEKGVPVVSPVPSGHDALPDWLGSAVGLYADVGESLPPARGERRVLIHIQDLHEVEEAQRNTASVLEQLTASLGGPKGLLVGLEGAIGRFRTEDFRALAPPAIVGQAADRFLKAGLFSGPEFFSFTTERRFRFWGVEDAPAYEANVRALTDTFPFQSKDDATVARALSKVETLKAQVYPPALHALDQMRSRYEEGQIGLAAYVRTLAEGVPPETLGPNLRLFLEAVAQEEDLSFSRVAEEQTRLLEKLGPLLSESETKQLMEMGLAHRMGRVRFSRFHSLLKSQSAAHGISLSHYPNLVAHADYAVKTEELNPTLVLRDTETLADRRFQSFLTTPRLVELAAVNADVRLVEKLNRFVLVPQEYQTLVFRRSALGQWRERATSCGAGQRVGSWPDLTPVLDRHEPFYLHAEARNRPMVQNLLSQWTEEAPAVLVAGGYHAEGVRAAVVSQGVGYISLIPRVSSTKNFPPPLASFRSNGESRDWVFRGDQSGLHNRLLTATGENRLASCFIGVIMALETLAALEEGRSWDPRETIVAAGKLGIKLSPENISPPRSLPDGGLALAVVDHSGNQMNITFHRKGDISVRINPPSPLKVVVASLTELDVSGLMVQVISGVWGRVADHVTAFFEGLGNASHRAAEELVKPFSWVGGHLGFSDQISKWKRNLRLSQDRRLMREAFNQPFAIREAKLSRLAESHPETFVPVLAEVIADANGEVGAPGRPTLESGSLSEQSGIYTVSVIVNGAAQKVNFRLSDSLVLVEEGVLFQLTRSQSGEFDVNVQMPVVSGAFGISKIVVKQILDEIAFQVEGKTPEEARSLASNPVDAMATDLGLFLLRMQNTLDRVTSEISTQWGGAVNLMVPPGLTQAVLSQWLGNPESPPLELVVDPGLPPAESIPVGLNSYFGGTSAQSGNSLQPNVLGNPERLREMLTGKGYPGSVAFLLSEWMASHYLGKSIEGLNLFSRFKSVRRHLFSPWLGKSENDRLSQPVLDVVLERLAFVGEQDGQLAALRAETRSADWAEQAQAALLENVSTQFLSLAQTLLLLLPMRGIHVEQATQAELNGFVGHLLRLYAAHFMVGYRGVMSVSRPTEELDAFSASVFHLTEPVETSRVVKSLLETLLRQAVNGGAKPLLIVVDFPEKQNASEVKKSLVARLEHDFAGSSGVSEAAAHLMNQEFCVVLDALVVRGDVADKKSRALFDRRSGVRISMAKVLGVVKKKWEGLDSVGIFTDKPSVFQLDVTSELISWVLFLLENETIVPVSQSVAEEQSRKAIAEFIRQQA